MTKLYKLTDQSGQTYGGCQWGEGVEHTASGEGELCGPGWLHAYTHPLLAVLLNPIHAGFSNPILWEAEGDVGLSDSGLKVGCKRLKTVRKIELPKVTSEQRVKFAILCAKKVYSNSAWNAWADNWLNGKDRSYQAALSAQWKAVAEVGAGESAARVAADTAASGWSALTATARTATARTATANIATRAARAAANSATSSAARRGGGEQLNLSLIAEEAIQ